MDEGLFLFLLFCSFVLLCAIVYCFLSTCLGLEIRRSDLWEAISLPSMSKIRERDRQRRARAQRMRDSLQAGGAGDYELDEMDMGPGPGSGLGAGLGGMAGEELEMLRRPGMGRYY